MGFFSKLFGGKSEREVLFPSGTFFLVENVEKVNN